jgi:4'-phosphopantetheinyl transferase
MLVPFFKPITNRIEWPDTPGDITPAGEIHVWQAALGMEKEQSPGYYDLLSDIEKARAERLRIEIARQRFIAAHANLRQVLGKYLHQAPSELVFETAAGGKPVLAGKSQTPGNILHFNLAHSRDLILISVSREWETGIDLEYVDTDQQVEQITHLFFSEADRDWLNDQPADHQVTAFFRLWTCKEAVLKAEGGGIRRGLKDVKMIFEINGNFANGILEGAGGALHTWLIRLFEPVVGYTAALAFENNASAAVDPKLSFFQWLG